ncbi:MAG TPA: hypothetical protein DF383_02585, partial [Deltaproteobacteria bacterium]|nr:hypothetical protein [Deltaproteobacteria bacterium]
AIVQLQERDKSDVRLQKQEEAFKNEGVKIFTDNNYKDMSPEMLDILRVQYLLRLEGYDIGKGGDGHWGGDGILGKKTTAAIHAVVKKYHKQNSNLNLTTAQTFARVIDNARLLKLGIGKPPYFDPAIGRFNAALPVWADKSPALVKASEKAEKLWSSRIIPALNKMNKRAIQEGSLKVSKEDFIRKFEGAHAERVLREGLPEQSNKPRIDKNFDAHAKWAVGEWLEIEACLKEKRVPFEAIALLKTDFRDNVISPYLNASSDAAAAKYQEKLIQEKKVILRRFGKTSSA